MAERAMKSQSGARGEADQEALLRVRRANSHLGGALTPVRETLAGRGVVGAEDLRAMATPVEEIAPLTEVAGKTGDALSVFPALRNELRIYAGHLREMQQEIDRLRCMLLANCAAIRARQNHLNAVDRFSSAWRQDYADAGSRLEIYDLRTDSPMTSASPSEALPTRPGQRLLVFDCHEAWVYQLRLLRWPLDIVVGLRGRHTQEWDESMRPIPPGLARFV